MGSSFQSLQTIFALLTLIVVDLIVAKFDVGIFYILELHMMSSKMSTRVEALFQRFQKFHRWSALFQNGLRRPALISAVSELFSAGFHWISTVQRWIKTKWENDENASCKFKKVLGSRKTCSFGVYQLWKKSFRRNSSQKFELTHPTLPHASWSHEPCRIVKRLKYRVLSKKWT